MYISIYSNYTLIGDHAVSLSSHEGVVTSEVEHKPPHPLHHSQTAHVDPSSQSLSAGLSGSTVHVCWYIVLLDIKKYVLRAYIISSPSLKTTQKPNNFWSYKRDGLFCQVGMF